MINEILLELKVNENENGIIITTDKCVYKYICESDLPEYHSAYFESFSDNYEEHYGKKILNICSENAFLNIITESGYITVEGRSDMSEYYGCYWYKEE